MKRFKILEHTADTGIIVYGKDLKEVFTNATEGLFSIITELDKVREVVSRRVSINTNDRESLLFKWLNELVYLFDSEGLLVKRSDIKELKAGSLKATVHGEIFDSARHKLKAEVKAATYHMLKIEKYNGSLKATVLFDI